MVPLCTPFFIPGAGIKVVITLIYEQVGLFFRYTPGLVTVVEVIGKTSKPERIFKFTVINAEYTAFTLRISLFKIFFVNFKVAEDILTLLIFLANKLGGIVAFTASRCPAIQVDHNYILPSLAILHKNFFFRKADQTQLKKEKYTICTKTKIS